MLQMQQERKTMNNQELAKVRLTNAELKLIQTIRAAKRRCNYRPQERKEESFVVTIRPKAPVLIGTIQPLT